MPKISKGHGPTIETLDEGHVLAGEGLRAQYDDRKADELRDELDNRNLDTSGKKDELVDRLVQDDVDRRRQAAVIPDPHAQPVPQEVLAGTANATLDADAEFDESDDEESDEDTELDDEYESMTAGQLRDELQGRALSTTGNKPDLVARLRDADSTRDDDQQ